MEKRSKCDVIPVWMFKELDAGAKTILLKEKGRLSKELTDKLEKVKEQQKEIAWNEIKGKKTEDCFEYYGRTYSPYFRLKKRISYNTERKQKSLENKVRTEYDNKLKRLDKKYEDWKMKVLIGKIPRSRIKGFEL